jgi:hypothetical protein
VWCRLRVCLAGSAAWTSMGTATAGALADAIVKQRCCRRLEKKNRTSRSRMSSVSRVPRL